MNHHPLCGTRWGPYPCDCATVGHIPMGKVEVLGPKLINDCECRHEGDWCWMCRGALRYEREYGSLAWLWRPVYWLAERLHL